MEAGKLRHKVTLEQLDTGQDSAGAVERSWSDFARDIWASVEPLSGREYFQAQQVASETSVRVRIRYRSGVLPTMRVVYGDRRFEILAVIDPEERHRELQLMCSETRRPSA
jgi:SPP1 family predicted phage head-tail adaptor